MSEPINTDEKRHGRTPGGQFGRGNTFSRGRGRPTGYRKKFTTVCDTFVAEYADELLNSILAAAQAGDWRAAAWALGRVWPQTQSRPSGTGGLNLTSQEHAGQALLAVIGAVSSGDLAAREAAVVVRAVTALRQWPVPVNRDEDHAFDFSALSYEELDTLESLLAKATASAG